MKNIVRLSLLFLLSNCYAGPYPMQQLRYMISPLWKNAGLQLKIEGSFTTKDSRQTLLQIPKGYGGQQSFQKCISALTVTCTGCQLEETANSWEKIVRHPLNTTVSFSYIFSNATSLTKEENVDTDVLPQLTARSFYFYGLSAWILPAIDPALVNVPLKVQLNWTGFPASWRLANSFGFNQRQQIYTGTVSKFAQTGFCGGDFRFLHFKIRNRPVTVAIYPEWQFKDSDMQNSVSKILSTESDFWQDFDFPHFFVAVIPPYEPVGGSAIRATAGTNSFFCTVTKITAPHIINRVFAHEMFHNWIPLRLGHMPDPKAFWFSEGFTNYYTFVMLLRAGLISLEQFITNINDNIRAYETSPVKNASEEQYRKYLFSQYGTYGKLSYQRGLLLVMEWNAEIKKRSAGELSLRDALRSMLVQAEKLPIILTDEGINSYLRNYTHRDLLPEIDSIWRQGKSFHLTQGMLAPHMVLTTVPIGPFELGYDADKTYAAKKITGLDSTSNAYAAGLREGQELVDDFYDPRDAQENATVIVKLGDKEKRITYLPEGKTKIQVSQIRISAGLTKNDSLQTVRWIIGQ